MDNANTAADSRTNWLEVDGDDGTPNNTPAAAQTRPPGIGTGGYSAFAPVRSIEKDPIDKEGAARAQASDAVAQKTGLVFTAPTLFAWGTKGQWGNAAARARAALNEQPLLKDLSVQAQVIVAGEVRQGHVVPTALLHYGADDCIRRKPPVAKDGMPMSAQALKQLVARVEGKGGAYLADAELPGELRATHVNHWIGRFNAAEADRRVSFLAGEKQATANAAREGKAYAPKPFEPARVKMLSKLAEGGKRVIYGTVGERYPFEYGMDAVIRDVVASFPGEVRGVLVYDASTTKWRVDAALGAQFEPVVGDIHRVGVKFGSHDAGGGAYWADLYAIRVRCVNFSKLNAGRKLGRVRHIGSIEALRKRIKALLEVGSEALHQFSELWKEANETAIIDATYGAGGDCRNVFRALIKAGYVSAPDGTETAVENYHQAWLKEPGETRSAYVNAITRAAHESPWSNPWATDELEEQAGKLLYNHVVLSAAQMEAAA
jgi:hypothetical protein